MVRHVIYLLLMVFTAGLIANDGQRRDDTSSQQKKEVYSVRNESETSRHYETNLYSIDVDYLKGPLSLKAKQRKKIRRLHQKSVKAQLKLKESIVAFEVKLKRLKLDKNIDKEEIKYTIKKLHNLQAKMHANYVLYLKTIEALLSAEQVKQFKAMFSDFYRLD